MIQITNLSIQAGDFSLKNISFEVQQGQYVLLMGKTGCGKTTILESLCGLKPIRSGKILLGGSDVTELPPAVRGIGYVPQDGALFPTMSVEKQLAFALEVRRWKNPQIAERVQELAELLQLTPLLKRKPHGLSGGERQRIALGRALAFRPKVLCLDEPLSALDETTRREMYSLLKSVQHQTGVTTLHITHSREEADALGDVVFHLNEGRLTRKLSTADRLADAYSPSSSIPIEAGT